MLMNLKNSYLFDVTLLASIRIDAESEHAAREKLKAILDCADCHFGWDSEAGRPVTGEASIYVEASEGGKDTAITLVSDD